MVTQDSTAVGCRTSEWQDKIKRLRCLIALAAVVIIISGLDAPDSLESLQKKGKFFKPRDLKL